ncbi:hypothetical protein F4778DRAFT_254867 [Xylariomycetidae sp. FL2044]|nr:hypothetical protein F4778DRAFT_254867 [Xylariomycetidae sp. FL2044]
MQASQAGDAPLEDRLRNLILTNTDTTVSPNAQPAFGPDVISHGEGMISPEPQETQSFSSPSQPVSRASKKRPNQAQRRQMNAQLSIPFDTREVPNPFRGAQMHTSHQFHTPRVQPQQRQYQPEHPVYQGPLQGSYGRHDHSYSTPPHYQPGFGQAATISPTHSTNWRSHQGHGYDGFPKGVNVVSADSFPARDRQHPHSTLYNPAGRHPGPSPEQIANQSAFLDQLCRTVVSNSEIEYSEIAEKEDFRVRVETICRDAISQYELDARISTGFHPQTVQLRCFGSLSSGFATKASDMDLGLLSPMSRLSAESPDSPIPRIIEKALLDAGFGARLLTRTRVPIIKLCELPTENLRQGLLTERAKWEKGLQDEPEAEDQPLDDQEDTNDPMTVPIEPGSMEKPHDDQKSAPQQSPEAEAPRNPAEKLASLRQSSNQSLMGYYGIAKRILRQLGGCDITHSNVGGFTEADFKLLDNVANAFVLGLRDDELKTRIRAYPSFNGSLDPYAPNCRTLVGVFTMVEGEKLVLLWEKRGLNEATPGLEQNFTKIVLAWKALHSRQMFGTDPLFFVKQSQTALDRLRTIPSIQLMQLRQDQHETPAQYHERAFKLMRELRGVNQESVAAPPIVECYVSGIHDDQVRTEVRRFVESSGNQSLKTIARKHEALHLAADYERAIEKGLYGHHAIPIIRNYVTVLQNDPVLRVPGTTDPFDLILPLTKNSEEILRQIKLLPDPSRLAPNQPRDRYHDRLEFPKHGIGVQCDINFSAYLALHNTALLRCYSYTDPRVTPLVLFVKQWAKARGINTAYRGTLSSYGYVLMVLHYLVNVAEPFVSPNLQELARPDPPHVPPQALEGIAVCQGHNVRFWRDEEEIKRLAHDGLLNHNRDSLGTLLRGFFEYYAQNRLMSTYRKCGFDWGRDVISLRTHGGLLSKQDKGWTGARTVFQPQSGAVPNPAEGGISGTQVATGHITQQSSAQLQSGQALSPVGPSDQSARPKELKEVRHRFLFAIEDPFELEHNVARTVTHNGIVAIRDEFRRAWRIIRSVGNNGRVGEDLMEDIKVQKEEMEKKQFIDLLKEIHGPVALSL